MYQKYSNFLNKFYHAQILSLLESRDFAWTYEINTHGGTQEYSDGTSGGFHHTVYYKDSLTSNYGNLFLPLVFEICNAINFNNLFSIQRIMCNMTLNINKQHDGFPHIDRDYSVKFPDHAKYITGLYYVNESDGDTLFYDKTGKNVIDRCSPEKNSIIVFDSSQVHSATLPMMSIRRIVVNTNIIGW